MATAVLGVSCHHPLYFMASSSACSEEMLWPIELIEIYFTEKE
jgi:hypothetical protein